MKNNCSLETMNAVYDILRQAGKFVNVYWWRPVKNAKARRAMEENESRPLVEWDEGGHHYTARYDVICTCGHIEAKGWYTKDGKKTNITAIRNSIKRIELDNLLDEMERDINENL